MKKLKKQPRPNTELISHNININNNNNNNNNNNLLLSALKLTQTRWAITIANVGDFYF
jgi:hypothetical protein